MTNSPVQIRDTLLPLENTFEVTHIISAVGIGVTLADIMPKAEQQGYLPAVPAVSPSYLWKSYVAGLTPLEPMPRAAIL